MNILKTSELYTLKCVNCISIKLLKRARSREEFGVGEGILCMKPSGTGRPQLHFRNLPWRPTTSTSRGRNVLLGPQRARAEAPGLLTSPGCLRGLRRMEGCGVWRGPGALACVRTSSSHRSVHLSSIHL